MGGNESKCYDCCNCKVISVEQTTSGSYRAILSCKKNHVIPANGKIISCDDYEEKTYIGGSSYFSPSCYRGTELDGAVYRKVED